MLLLCAPPPGWGDEDDGVQLPMASAVASTGFEPAGAAFHAKCMARLGMQQDG